MLNAPDAHLSNAAQRSRLRGWLRSLTAFLHFGINEARSRLFAGLLLSAVFLLLRTALLALPRYDVLPLAVLAVRGVMLWRGLETWDECKAIYLLHAAGIVQGGHSSYRGLLQSWSYLDFAYTGDDDVHCRAPPQTWQGQRSHCPALGLSWSAKLRPSCLRWF
ncbi:hypothetical protein BA896_006850 [Janthinobacterium lividum]|uniref:Uncharacterized protein n=1 Tax=Janthinobacterium lividum TaxID=29581 RepID=A0A1E8PS05_9BURK|nr:hypothetical protein BA896_006850 [Janthinobacterium lividum]